MEENERRAEKEHAEAAILRTIEAIEREGRQPDDWEKINLIHALDDLFRGLYRLARTDAELARTPKSHRSPVPIRIDTEMDQVDLTRIRAVLDDAKLESVRPPFFGKWTGS